MVAAANVGVPWQYSPLAVFGFAWAFADSFGIGANDVANSFSTAVASKTLTHRQAVTIALFAEFTGAMVLGSSVTDTVRKKVLDVGKFEDDPYVLMLGMTCSVVGSAVWVLTATCLEMPVSSTHATIGAIMGVGCSAFGSSGIVWDLNKGGVLSIVLSWFTAPFFAGLIAASLYHSVKVAVLSYSDAESFRRGLKTLPWYAFFTWGTISGFMVLKGSPALGLDKLPLAYTLPCVVLLATLAAVAARFMLVPWLIRVIQRGEDIPWYQMHRTACLPTVAPEGEDGRELVSRSRGDDNEDGVAEEEEECDEGVRSGMSIAVARGDRRGGLDREEDIHEAREDAPAGAGKSGVGVGVLGKIVVDISDECDEKSVHLAECAVKHCSATERLYQVLQVSTCVFASISHGANDIANAVGPLASIWMVYSTGRVSSQAPVPWWILAYGAIGLDVGLMTYGHHIMRALGNKICYHSPSRGFCMDLGAMFTVLSLSKLGVPVSTTHCKSGATAAVGLVSSGRLEAVNWNMIAIILFGWVLTLPAAGLISGSLFYLLATTWGPRPVAGNGFFEFS